MLLKDVVMGDGDESLGTMTASKTSDGEQQHRTTERQKLQGSLQSKAIIFQGQIKAVNGSMVS